MLRFNEGRGRRIEIDALATGDLDQPLPRQIGVVIDLRIGGSNRNTGLMFRSLEARHVGCDSSNMPSGIVRLTYAGASECRHNHDLFGASGMSMTWAFAMRISNRRCRNFVARLSGHIERISLSSVNFAHTQTMSICERGAPNGKRFAISPDLTVHSTEEHLTKSYVSDYRRPMPHKCAFIKNTGRMIARINAARRSNALQGKREYVLLFSVLRL